MVEVNEKTTVVNDVSKDAEATTAELVEESMMDKVKTFGRTHKKALMIAGAAALAVGGIVVKTVFFPSGEVEDFDDDAEGFDGDINVE